jgi:glyoxylase-like metal-dependent hydrolase (beta-lactamase superfamily II)
MRVLPAMNISSVRQAAETTVRPEVQAFYEAVTGTVSYVVYEAPGSACAIIDPVLDYDPAPARTSTVSADRILAFVRGNRLSVEWILETHAHADHLSAAAYLRAALGGRIAIGERIRDVQAAFSTLFNLGPAFAVDGSQFDHLFADGETFLIGGLPATVLHVPGHTPADLAYRVGEAVFVGDTLFMPDVGTARADFPGGNGRTLYRSIRRILDLPADTRLFVCHDYPPENRKRAWQTTVAEQRRRNIHVHDGIGEEGFIRMRNARDRTLEVPKLMLPAIQVNIRAGELPPPESDGRSYLRIPVNALSTGRP